MSKWERKYNVENTKKKSKSILIRLDDDTMKKLDFLADTMKYEKSNRSQTIRELIELQYRALRKNKTCRSDYKLPDDFPF